MDLQGLNGPVRNVVKLFLEMLKVFSTVYAGLVRLTKALGEVTHSLFDLLVEPLRTSPYFWGHLVGFYLIWKAVEYFIVNY